MVLDGSIEIGVDIVEPASWFGVVFVGLIFTLVEVDFGLNSLSQIGA